MSCYDKLRKDMKVLDNKPKESLNQFLELYSNIRPMEENHLFKTQDLIAYYKKSKATVMDNPLQHLESQWFDALINNEIDYSVYSHEDYFTEVWACWAVYSRTNLKLIEKHKNRLFPEVKSVLDLGNGLGMTTVALTEMFTDASVTGTNLKISEQWKFCELLQKSYSFDMREDSKELGHVDLVFALEYFEHIHDPIAHVEEIIEHNKPKYMVICNSFGTIGIGHFKTYETKRGDIDCKKMSKLFRDTMKAHGYEKIKTGIFNDTPNVYKLNENENFNTLF